MDIVCGACGHDNLVRDKDAPKSPDIPLLCLDCGWRGSRTPEVACPRCGSKDYDETPVDSWAYGDLEAARENPGTAEWGYLDKTHYRCGKCRHDWTSAGPYRPYASPSGGKVLATFKDDDVGYQAWLSGWREGFVLNCHRQPSADYLILHRASCQFINVLQTGMRTFTGEYIKVCSTDRASVLQWARRETGAEATYCSHCL